MPLKRGLWVALLVSVVGIVVSCGAMTPQERCEADAFNIAFERGGPPPTRAEIERHCASAPPAERPGNSTTDWITAVATFLTFVATIALVIVAWVELRGARRDAERARSLPARKVVPIVQSYRMSTTAHETFSEVTIRNGSDDPVFEVSLQLLPWDWESHGDEPPRLDGRYYATILGGSETAPEDVSDGLVLSWGNILNPPYQLIFTDHEGVKWRRDPRGRLKRLN